MEQLYTVAEHGDLLEQEGAAFIRKRFQNYELVWQKYIGNTGEATMAPMPGYLNEKKRKSFAEHSYSTFESCFLIQDLINSGVFIDPLMTRRDYIRFTHAFLSFFFYLGRIHDTVIKAAQDLGYNYSAFERRIKEFYEARSIVVHGKKVPIIMDQDGHLIMPILKTENANGAGWNDKGFLWSDVAEMDKEFVSDTIEGYFYALMEVINEEYGHFLAEILADLACVPTKLQFVRIAKSSLFILNEPNVSRPSGSTLAGQMVGINVYNMNHLFAK